MSIISNGGKRSWKIRLIIACMYTILLLGSVTMVYPFMLTLSSSVTDKFDFDDFVVIPKYVYSDDALMKKYLFEKYGQLNFQSLSYTYKRDNLWINWNNIRNAPDFISKTYAVREKELNQAGAEKALADWALFKKSLPPSEVLLFFAEDITRYQEFMKDKYTELAGGKEADGLALLNRRWCRSFGNFAEILPLLNFPFEQKWIPPVDRPDYCDYIEYVNASPPGYINPVSLQERWAKYLCRRFISVQNFSRETGIRTENFSEVECHVGKDDVQLYPVWEKFLRTSYPVRLIGVDRQFAGEWGKYIKSVYMDIKSFNKASGENAESFDAAVMPESLPANPLLRIIWTDFVLKQVPVGEWILNDPCEKYLKFLEGKYQTVDNLNREYRSSYGSFAEIALPFMHEDYMQFMKNKNQMRWNYLAVNYWKVVEYLMTKGRAFSVTLTLVMLSILAALTVNPLAAYALSRGKQSVANKFLIFFLATMAFPAEIAMIPGFLLIRDLGLLNTMSALILPGLANGYSIFLLKGFFDSIPKELYEAADVDGAGEFVKFYHITFPMSKPILAVIALGAFNAAYGGFMWAFLTCQDKNMWTIMVWLYDFQSRSPSPGMTMASLVLTSLPTLLVFIFCQNIIMRGIVVPTMT